MSIGHTIYTEQYRTANMEGVTSVTWECSKCKHRFTTVQQQNLSYCPHCGRKIIKRTGGGIHPRPEMHQIIYRKT